MNILMQIIGYIGVVITIILAVPQLVKTIKEKNGNVKTLSFFILYFGLISWSLYGAFINSDDKAIHVVVANILSLIILGVTICLFFHYRNSRHKLSIWFLNVIINILVIVFSVLAIANNWKLNNIGAIIMSILSACCTTFAFAPSLVYIFKTKDVKFLSPLLLWLGFGTNLTWEIYFSIFGSINGFTISIIVSLVLQPIAMIIFLSQIYMIWKYGEKKQKIKKEK